MRLLLVRHGQTSSNVEGLLDTAVPGAGLTVLGGRQAAAIPAALSSAEVTGVFASPHRRAQQTAAPLAAALGVATVTVDGLREVEAGGLEMASDGAAVETYLRTIFSWARGDLDVRMPAGVDGHAFFARFDRAVAEIAASAHAEAVVVAHGAAIRAWTSARVRGLSVHQMESTSFSNTAWVLIDGDSLNGWELVDWSPLPLGGAQLLDQDSDDPTGEAVDQVEA